MDFRLRIIFLFRNIQKDLKKIKKYIKEKSEKKIRACVEITTVMGCANDCLYCPQKLLMQTYYKDNKNRQSSMTMEDFKTVLRNMPKNYVVNFGGMSEPFANPLTIDFIKEADRQKRLIRINSTLRHVSLEDLKKIKNINFYYFCVHTPDKDYIQKQKADDEYLEKIKLVKTFKNVEFSVIGYPHESILEVLDNKITISKIVLRANNLEKGKMPLNIIEGHNFRPYSIDTQVVCSRIFEMEPIIRKTRTEWPVLLPDGTLLLCCEDYGMKHVLGNLYQNTYEEIMESDVMHKIEDSMLCKNRDYLLCRDCELAVVCK